MDGRLQVFAGNSSPALANRIVSELEAPLGRAIVGSWKDGETRVKLEENVRGSDVFVIQTMSRPVNQNLMELLVILDALRRASAARITAVIPYYAYARQEKKTSGREPISAKLVANLLVTAGADRILTMDLHSPAIEGFFDIQVDHLRATPILAAHFRRLGLDDLVVVSPDSGSVARAEEFRRRTGGSLAIISKQRPGPERAEVLEMVGDVEGRHAVIVDDMISSGWTLVKAAEALLARGARSVRAAAVHGVFAGEAMRLIQESPIEKVFVTDTLPLPEGVSSDKVEVLTVAPLIAEAIMRIHKDLSISALFT
ncbi:ribose-phosphate diphosphokinase [Sphaerobacter thermophilus]|jgi:ribose-phosphate pyrophosphokinase|uniref:ribose-phosphate diphosphokinase n=1 Tax=Sphaerobacter thermophilus TaxID=2057 RepID=UPI000DB7FAD1|nr:MAG: ribose-phosphate diphosphokinase [Sphaerobacter thermophilus]